jgi:hypothetical protein
MTDPQVPDRDIDLKLVILKDRSLFTDAKGVEHEFKEGAVDRTAQDRMRRVRTALDEGFLTNLIRTEKEYPVQSEIPEECARTIQSLVGSVTSEVGRALIGIAVMQLSIKAICPDQSVRLHKGGAAGGENFSWVQGISMRTLDKAYITPALRHFGLLNLNADGFMMTRSLAENYPYTALYKAAIRGGKRDWLQIVEDLETGHLNGTEGLRYLISLLINRSTQFESLAIKCVSAVDTWMKASANPTQYYEFIDRFVQSSDYSARVFEIALHAAYQALDEMRYVSGTLKPISQMRSANKKHGNVGDIEILKSTAGMLIGEAIDAKFGKVNLREELEELSEKLAYHPECEVAGFVCDREPLRSPEIVQRMAEIGELHNCTIGIESFSEWFSRIMDTVATDEIRFCQLWLKALTESLCQRRREVAPIDEPCEAWIRSLATLAGAA